MDHQQLVEALRAAVERSKGVDVELSYGGGESVVAANIVTTLTVAFAGSGGTRFICLSSIREHLLPLGDAHAISIDLFGEPHREVVFGGRVESRLFNIKIAV